MEDDNDVKVMSGRVYDYVHDDLFRLVEYWRSFSFTIDIDHDGMERANGQCLASKGMRMGNDGNEDRAGTRM